MRSPRRLSLAALPLVVLLGLTACQTPTRPLSESDRQTVQAATAKQFPAAFLFKPTKGGFDQPLEVRLAPLLVLEANETETHAPQSPRVTCQPGIVLLNNRWHRQFTYSWEFSTGPTFAGGIRLTLDATDNPVIWEVLDPASDLDVIYVAKSIEPLAKTQYGAPLPGQNFSVARTPVDSPRTVVANVIEDSPTPLGPIVYIDSPTRKVTAVICRCMPSQFTNLIGQAEFELRFVSQQTNGFPPRLSLEKRLRLPARF